MKHKEEKLDNGLVMETFCCEGDKANSKLIGQYKAGTIWVYIYDDGTYYCDNWEDHARGRWKIVDGDLHFKTYHSKAWECLLNENTRRFLEIVNGWIVEIILLEEE